MKIQPSTTGGTIDQFYFDSKSEYEVGLPQVITVDQNTGKVPLDRHR